MSKHIFREYDIRGIFEKELKEDIVKKIGYYVGLKIKEFGDNVIVGYDCRTHSQILFNWLISGLNKAKLNVYSLDFTMTPIAYFAGFQKIDNQKINASIMITGSHLTKEYNGFKITIDNKPFFSNNISFLGDEIINSTVKIKDNFSYIKTNINKKYIDFLVDRFSYLKGFNKELIFDCGNGVAGPFIREIIKRLNLNAKILFESPDGNFPNHQPDPSEEKNMLDLKKECRNKIGFAFDGDADRLGVIDKEIIKPDILATQYVKEMNNPIVIGEVKCSLNMYNEINKIGKSIMYKTGNCNIKNKLIETKANLGIEYSGHIFFNDDYYGYDDAFYAMLRVLKLIYNGENLSLNISKLPKTYQSEEIKISVDELNKFEILKNIINNIKENLDSIDAKSYFLVDGIRIEFEHGWGLIRASNTSPNLTSRFEATNENAKEKYEKIILDIVNKFV